MVFLRQWYFIFQKVFIIERGRWDFLKDKFSTDFFQLQFEYKVS